MSVLLTLRDVRKSFGGRLLLEIGRLEVPEHGCVVLTGRNGAGKTTLLKIIAGLERPDHAEVVLGGSAQPWERARSLLRRDTVYLHQHPYMFDASVEENVGYGLRRAGLKGAALHSRVTQALRWAGLAHLAGKNARRLSGGEKQRVALTRARVLSPRLLLLDEPFANMDRDAREQTLYSIRQLRSEGISTIVTTHEPEVARAIGGQHQHLCMTGPCRFQVVEPFLYERKASTVAERPPMTTPGTAPSPPATPGATGKPGSAPGRDGVSPREAIRDEITGVILAGGRGQRMGGQDKGLLVLNGQTLTEHLVETLRPQVGALLINANRNLERYRDLGYPVVPDAMGEFFGPLVGVASAMAVTETPYLLTAPCDSPLLPSDLAGRLYRGLRDARADIAVVHDGRRMQPVFALLRRELLPDLQGYLERGGRKIDTWYAEHRFVQVDYSDQPEAFLNVNTPEEWAELERRKSGR